MHQHPPKMPLLRSTSAANAAHVDSSRAFTVYVGSDTQPSLMRARARRNERRFDRLMLGSGRGLHIWPWPAGMRVDRVAVHGFSGPRPRGYELVCRVRRARGWEPLRSSAAVG